MRRLPGQLWARIRRHRVLLSTIALGLMVGVQLAERDLLRMPMQEIVTGTLQEILGPEPLRSPDGSILATDGCLCPTVQGLCPCGSTTRRVPFEATLWQQIETAGWPPPPPLLPDFRNRLAEAVGYAAIQPRTAEGGARGRTIQEIPFQGGTAKDIQYAYDRPKATMRAILAQHRDPRDDLIIVLHGMWSSASRVMGLGERDYLNAVGERMFQRGLDVLAFDLPSNGTLSTWLNMEWQGDGVQLFGLWAHAICQAKAALVRQHGYRRVFLYGLSNGGRTAEYTAALCPGFDAVVVDDNWIPGNDFPLRNPITHASNLKLLFWVDHLTPALLGSSLRDFVAGAQSPIFYTVRRDEIEAISEALSPAFRAGGPISATTQRGVLVKRIDDHVPEFDLLDGLVDRNWPALEGTALMPAAP